MSPSPALHASAHTSAAAAAAPLASYHTLAYLSTVWLPPENVAPRGEKLCFAHGCLPGLRTMCPLDDQSRQFLLTEGYTRRCVCFHSGHTRSCPACLDSAACFVLHSTPRLRLNRTVQHSRFNIQVYRMTHPPTHLLTKSFSFSSRRRRLREGTPSKAKTAQKLRLEALADD